jgi:hypothetical protein
LLTLAALVPGFHEVVVRFRGDGSPFAEGDIDRPEAAVIGALAQEGHRLRASQAILNDVVEALIRVSETHLVLLPARRSGSHGRRSVLAHS